MSQVFRIWLHENDTSSQKENDLHVAEYAMQDTLDRWTSRQGEGVTI